MEMYPLIFVIHILIFFPIPTHSLSCVSCQGINCPVVTDCDAGMTLDVCNCCPVCAQGEGDKCGGSFDIHGKCGLGLYCDQQAKQNGICKACTEVIYSGCTVVHGICQCGNSCTHSFDFADKESCLNSVLTQGDTDYCAGKQCPADPMIECPEDSYRPAKKLSVDGCCQLPQLCKCLETGCHNPPSCPAGTMVAELSRGNGEPGNCCSQYTCVNTSLECGVDNSSFTSESDSCIECKCKSGIVTCGYHTCSLPSWKCCPVCEDKDTYAVYNGTFPDITTPVICPEESDCPTNCRKKLTVEINGCAVCLCEDDILMCPGSTKCSLPHF
ncbi:CRIM1 [Bugula neritina]|uniref:CRIM1 n=1 Tax=Bugula neritina TaxID=10212 RepID=A0A7J7J3B6_BUGNE|nr:CRIM1 [Bugula neritina]